MLNLLTNDGTILDKCGHRETDITVERPYVFYIETL